MFQIGDLFSYGGTIYNIIEIEILDDETWFRGEHVSSTGESFREWFQDVEVVAVDSLPEPVMEDPGRYDELEGVEIG